ncbi:hypothetical protein ADK76_21810, partial [Streptomyces griseoflavus]
VAAVGRLGAAAPLARRRVLDWGELTAHPLLVTTVTGSSRSEIWTEECRPRLACTADNLNEWLEPGAAGQGVACPAGNFEEWLEAVAGGHGVGVAPQEVAHRHTH